MTRANNASHNNDQVDATAASDATTSGAAAHASAPFTRKRACQIVVDSCGDFAPAVARRIGVEVIGFPYVGPEGERIDDLWESISPHDFYETMRKGAVYHTAAVSPGRYIEVFEKYAKEQVPVLYLAFTAGLSSSVYAAEQAAEQVMADYPGSEVYVLDNRCPSAAAELLAIEVTRLADMGLSAKELRDWAADACYFIHGYFTLESFDALAAGGRIPPAAAQVGGKLDIKPELSYDTDGSLVLRGMCRGRKKALRAIVADFRENYTHDASLPMAIVSADAEKDADWLEGAIRKEKGCEDLVIIRSSVTPILGSHVGPGMVAIVFWGVDRRKKVSLTDRIAQRVRSRGNDKRD